MNISFVVLAGVVLNINSCGRFILRGYKELGIKEHAGTADNADKQYQPEPFENFKEKAFKVNIKCFKFFHKQSPLGVVDIQHYNYTYSDTVYQVIFTFSYFTPKRRIISL